MKLSISSFFKNPGNRYLTLWCIYLLQGTLYAEGGFVSRTIIVLIVLISFSHIKTVFNDIRVKNFFKVLLCLVALYTLHGLLLLLTGGSTLQVSNQTIAIGFLQSFYISVLPIFSFYHYAQKGYLNANTLRFWTPVFVIVAIALFYRMQSEALEKIATGAEGITNNAGYVMAALIPCVFAFKKQWIQYLFLSICAIFIVFSMKRGAMLTGGIAVALYFIMRTRHLSLLKRLLFVIVSAFICIIIFNYLSDSVFQNDYFQRRLELTLEGESSGRDALLSKCIDYYINQESIFQQVFGMGANGTFKIAGNGAHNDWVEMLLNQGLVGLAMFFLFWIYFFKVIVNKSYSYLSRDVLTLIFVICFLRTLYSQSINDISIFLSSFWGVAMCDGFFEKKR